MCVYEHDLKSAPLGSVYPILMALGTRALSDFEQISFQNIWQGGEQE